MGNSTPSGDELTTAQVVELTGYSVTAINRWAANGELPSRKIPGGRTSPRLFDRAAVDDFFRDKPIKRRELVASP